MNFVAMQMLIGDRGKYLGILLGLTFTSFLITNQLAMFFGVMTRTYSAVTAHHAMLQTLTLEERGELIRLFRKIAASIGSESAP